VPGKARSAGGDAGVEHGREGTQQRLAPLNSRATAAFALASYAPLADFQGIGFRKNIQTAAGLDAGWLSDPDSRHGAGRGLRGAVPVALDQRPKLSPLLSLRLLAAVVGGAIHYRERGGAASSD
jgi:hypothetical protein